MGVQDPSSPDLNWGYCDPRFCYRLGKLVQYLRERGFQPRIVETYRTQKRQEYLYQIGRTTEKGRKPVTWTQYSRHTAGFAADLCDRVTGYGNNKFFAAVGKYCAGGDLKWRGGDSGHVEMPGEGG